MFHEIEARYITRGRPPPLPSSRAPHLLQPHSTATFSSDFFLFSGLRLHRPRTSLITTVTSLLALTLCFSIPRRILSSNFCFFLLCSSRFSKSLCRSHFYPVSHRSPYTPRELESLQWPLPTTSPLSCSAPSRLQRRQVILFRPNPHSLPLPACPAPCSVLQLPVLPTATTTASASVRACITLRLSQLPHPSTSPLQSHLTHHLHRLFLLPIPRLAIFTSLRFFTNSISPASHSPIFLPFRLSSPSRSSVVAHSFTHLCAICPFYPSSFFASDDSHFRILHIWIGISIFAREANLSIPGS